MAVELAVQSQLLRRFTAIGIKWSNNANVETSIEVVRMRVTNSGGTNLWWLREPP